MSAIWRELEKLKADARASLLTTDPEALDRPLAPGADCSSGDARAIVPLPADEYCVVALATSIDEKIRDPAPDQKPLVSWDRRVLRLLKSAMGKWKTEGTTGHD